MCFSEMYQSAMTRLPFAGMPGIALFAAIFSAGAAFGAEPASGKLEDVNVDDPRPVAKAIETLEGKYGWIITYEDARYVHDGDLRDATQEVRKDLHLYPKGDAPKVLVPKGGCIVAQYPALEEGLERPGAAVAVVQTILSAHAAAGNPGVFEVIQGDSRIHVVPAQVKDAAGKLTPQGSILDSRISVPSQERTGLDTLQAICDALGGATQYHVVMGTIPTNLFAQSQMTIGGDNESARDLLVRTLNGIDKRLSWQIFYDPGLKWYVMNIHRVER